MRRVGSLSVKIAKYDHICLHINSSEEYIGRFGAVLTGDSCKKEKLKGADAFNAVYTALNNEFNIDGWTARDIAKRIVYGILDL